MNWHQVYATATRSERQQIAFTLLEHLQKHPPLPRLRYHFVGPGRQNKKAQLAYLSAFIFILGTVSVATWLILHNVPPAYGAPMVFFWHLALFATLWIQPVRRTHWA